MVFQRVERPFRGGDDLDPEPVEQRAGAERGGGELFVDGVEIVIRSGAIEHDVDAESLREHPVEPEPRRRAAKQMIVFRQDAPRRARIEIAHAIHRRHAQRLEPHALRIEHTKQVVIGHKQQLGRVLERRIGRPPARIGVPVRTYDRQAGDLGVKRAGDVSRGRIGRKQPIRMQGQRARLHSASAVKRKSRNTVSPWPAE